MTIESYYSTEARDVVVELYRAGIPMKLMAAENPLVPPLGTLYAWIANNKDFSDLLDANEKHRARALAEATLDIADTEPDPARARVRTQVRQWLAGKQHREKYGEKVDVTHNHHLQISGVLAEANERLKALCDAKNDMIDITPSQPVDLATHNGDTTPDE